MYEAEGHHVKLLSEHFDRIHTILLQYAGFLTLALSPPTTYAAFLPSLRDLVCKYHISGEVGGQRPHRIP